MLDTNERGGSVRAASARMLALRALAVLFALILLPLSALGETGKVVTSSLVLRASASKNSKALQTLGRGDKVYILGSSGSWYRVSFGSYRGYVLKQYVTLSGGSSGGSSGTPSGGNSSGGRNVPTEEALLKKLRSIGKPSACGVGSTGSNVKKLQRCLQACGYYRGSIDGVYGSSTKSAVQQLQRAKGLRQTGNATRQTIGAMFGQYIAEEDFVTESLDWFHGGKDVIPKGAVFTVKDCRTGKTFTCKRWSGGNHMDTMPLTKKDTAVMKSLYGTWSWTRRPILVQYNGHVYAASMNGMPHGTTTIRNNGFPGHFCIHFLGSMTHGSKKVDPTHQQCVKTAMRYSW